MHPYNYNVYFGRKAVPIQVQVVTGSRAPIALKLSPPGLSCLALEIRATALGGSCILVSKLIRTLIGVETKRNYVHSLVTTSKDPPSRFSGLGSRVRVQGGVFFGGVFGAFRSSNPV